MEDTVKFGVCHKNSNVGWGNYNLVTRSILIKIQKGPVGNAMERHQGWALVLISFTRGTDHELWSMEC